LSDPTGNDLQDIYNWASNLRCSALHLQFPTRQGRNAPLPCLSLGPTQEHALRKAVSSLMTVPTTVFHVSRLWYQRWSGASSNCGANDRQLIIRADGTISPCNACKYSMQECQQESILNSPASLMTMWENSTTLRAYRSV